MKEPIYQIIIGACLAMVIILSLAWLVSTIEDPKDQVVLATPAREVAREVTIPLNVELVKVFEPEVKRKLDLPKSVQQDKKKHVVAASKVKADTHPHTVITVLDQTTGEFSTYDRKDPLPWVSKRNTTHLAAYYGIKNSETVVRLQVQQEILSIKAVTIEAVANTDLSQENHDTFVGIGARVSF